MSDDVNISYVRARYEYIRLGVEAFFKAEPEPEGKRDWTLFRFEDFDVFECRKGRKYRKRSEGQYCEAGRDSSRAQSFQTLNLASRYQIKRYRAGHWMISSLAQTHDRSQ